MNPNVALKALESKRLIVEGRCSIHEQVCCKAAHAGGEAESVTGHTRADEDAFVVWSEVHDGRLIMGPGGQAGPGPDDA